MRTLAVPETAISRGPLLLVNQGHPYRSAGTERLAPLDDGGLILLDTTASALLRQLIRAVRGDGRIIPVSGHRSRRDQERLYYNSLLNNGREFTNKFVAQPDHSEHLTGLAVDLADGAAYVDPICPSFPYDGVFGDFRRLAARYGFIERYGADKETLTGIAHEPWHFRYVGYPHALYMEENNLCLEEYLELLRGYPSWGTHLSCGETEIFYADTDCAMSGLSLPDACFQISGNNVDGVIVTVWRRRP